MKLYTDKIKGTFLGVLAFLIIPAVSTGCSENIEDGLYAADDSNIGISIEAQGFHNGLLEIGSAQSSTIFTVTSTTRWTVEITDCEGSWCQIIYGEGASDGSGRIGDGTFTVEAAPNRSGNARECNVTVYAIEIDGTHIPGKSVEIHLEQDRQSIQVDYAGDVISSYGTSAGSMPNVTVTANQAWTASSSHTWVKIVPGDGMTGDSYQPEDGSTVEKSISFRISVDGNPGTSVRNAEVTISSPTSAFTPIRLTVTQEGSTDTFFVTPTEVSQIPFTGGVVEFQVYSPRESWTVSTVGGNWVALDRTSGEASSEAVTVKATIAPNDGSSIRQAGVVFKRAGEMGETIITLTQGGSTAAPDPEGFPSVSAPWLGSGWSSTYVRVFAYVSDPVIPVSGCGVFIEPVNNPDAVRVIPGELLDNNMMFVGIDNLSPNTEYKVWPYVEFIYEGSTMVGAGEEIYFTTPDINGGPAVTPGAGDNNPPSAN